MRLSELAEEVRRRASYRCEYCRIPQFGFRRQFHIEHIIARQHGGLTELDNLALACWTCNLKKGPNLTGIDPTRGQLVRLYHPRKDRWTAHFTTTAGSAEMGIAIHGTTSVGRATVRLLGMNGELRPLLRYELWRESGF